MDVADSPMSDRPALARLLSDQEGVLSITQLSTVDAARAVAEKRRGRWQSPARAVYVAHNGPLTDRQRLRVALACGGPMAASSGATALALDGLRGFEVDLLFVTVPCGARRLRTDEVVTKFSRFLTDDDVHPTRVPRRTRVARSLLDAAAWATTDVTCRSILLAGVQQRLATPVQLREALPRRGPCLRHALILETIADAEGGVASVPESDFDVLRRRAGLPTPSRQVALQRPQGRYYLDVRFDEYHVCVEIDGQPHMRVTHWDADLDRQNEIVLGQDLLLRFTSYALRHKAESVMATLTRALVLRGWRPA